MQYASLAYGEWTPLLPELAFLETDGIHSLQQRFPNCGPRTPGGPWGSDRKTGELLFSCRI